MPPKRQALETLTRNELLALADLHGLEVEDRRVRDQLVDAASSRKVVLADAVAEFSRDRLKELCRELGLDDAGREKAQLVERLTGQAAKEPALNGKNGRGNGAAANGEHLDLGLGEKRNLAKLEGYLWSAADILRGSIDSSDYKGFIFGMLFLKRLSDRFDEECEALVADGIDPEDQDEHQFFVPKRARWSEIQRTAVGVGEALNKACAELERVNSSLEGVLAGIDFNDERRLGDTRNRDVVLSKLVQHFSKVDLRNARLSEPDMLGRAYEYLIESWYRQHAEERLPERVEAWAKRFGIPTPTLLVREQRRRWGSCNEAGEVRLNWRIIQARLSLVDYVIAHELTHVIRGDDGHSAAFRAHLGRVMPDYDARREVLRVLGPSLEW